ncbi:hypothetical protein HMPREF0080_00269 [Anaeroglobus geminatus F0357]|uniref:Uncharacterized protein n=2 Tax=Anaeroglobus TaxID=156454 RepID=G9YF59_9FIRM|nr:hypothetical protein HMPREF0080_00269 [Anaeroglobus geminatus F0357]
MLFKQDPLLHVLIFLFAGLICFFPASPSVTCTGLILMCGPAVLLQTYVLRRRRFRTISTVTGLIASAAMYTLSITADNTGVSAVLLNLSALWLFTVLLQYVTCDATDNAVSAVYERFLQFIKSGAVATLICILLAVILLFTSLILPSGIYFDIVRGVISAWPYGSFFFSSSFFRTTANRPPPAGSTPVFLRPSFQNFPSFREFWPLYTSF